MLSPKKRYPAWKMGVYKRKVKHIYNLPHQKCGVATNSGKKLSNLIIAVIK
jgi:hypothetical protein